MKIIIALLLLFTCNTKSVIGQAGQTVEPYFLVTFDKFTPPTQALISNFEGRPAESFLASDINGNEHYLSDYIGKKVILWFWDIEDVDCINHLSALNQLAEANPSELQVISFARKGSSTVKKFVDSHQVSFPVIPNADVFGQMAYGAELGYPRYFFIDEFGIVQVVLPDQAFDGERNLFEGLKAIYGGL